MRSQDLTKIRAKKTLNVVYKIPWRRRNPADFAIVRLSWRRLGPSLVGWSKRIYLGRLGPSPITNKKTKMYSADLAE